MSANAPLIAHIIHALRMGGLENGLVNLINRMPAERYRHAIVCMTGYDRFAERIERDDVRLVAVNKQEGKDPAAYLRLWRVLRDLRPNIVHTRNMATLEGQLPAFLAGVPGRVHGEHGRDMLDLVGANRRYRLLRRLYRPLIHRFVPLSADLEAYLREQIGVPRERITRIINGVDTTCFRPHAGAGAAFRAERRWPADVVVVGWVGRMEAVKNPLGLLTAFEALQRRHPDVAGRFRLALVGGGSQYNAVAEAAQARGLGDAVWMPGPCDDVAGLLSAFDLFVLPSLAEGISNTILEAMASGIPVLATDVGGNRELVVAGRTGTVVPARDAEAMADVMAAYAREPGRLTAEGLAARRRAKEAFSIDAMVAAYVGVYDRVLTERRDGFGRLMQGSRTV